MTTQQGMLAFDEETGRKLEALYATPHAVARREAALMALDPAAGQRGLDIGPGPGLLACELAERIGPTGRLVAIDTNPAMLAMTARRAEAQQMADRIELREADATALPRDGTFDFVVASQVYEYVPDIALALTEAARVLRPGGRLAIIDTEWDSLTIHADDTERTRRAAAAWDLHLAHPNLPRRLPGLLRRAGLELTSVKVLPIVSLKLEAGDYAAAMVDLIADYIRDRADFTASEVDAWLADLRRQSDSGAFFFSLNQYLFRSVRPGE